MPAALIVDIDEAAPSFTAGRGLKRLGGRGTYPQADLLRPASPLGED